MARRKKVAFEITAREKKATASLRKITARFQKLIAPVDKLNRKLRQTQRALQPVINRLNQFSRKMDRFGKKASMGLTLPIAAAGVAVVRTATGFQSGMLKVKSLTQATGEQFKSLENLARSMGTSTQFSARQSADAMGYLGMAGFKTKQIMASLPGVLNLASASGLDLAETADYASNILTGFGIENNRMGEIGDKLTYAFTNSNTSLSELAHGLAKAGGIASKAGLKFEDITATMMGLADAGHKAENAGVAVAGAIARVAKFTLDPLMSGKENMVSRTLKNLGINAEDFIHTTGDKRSSYKIPFIRFIQLLDSHGAKLDDYTRIMGQDAGKYIAGLSGQFEKLSGYMQGLLKDSKDLAKYHAKVRNSGAEGGFKLLSSALGELAIVMGKTGFLDTVDAISRSLAYLVTEISKANPTVLKFAGGLLAGLFVVGPLVFAIGSLGKVLKFLAPFMAVFIKGTVAAATVLGGKILAITVAIGAVVYGLFLLFKNWSVITDWMAKEWNKFTDGIKFMAKNAGLALKISFVNATNDVIDNLNKVLKWIKGSGLDRMISKIFGVEVSEIPHLDRPEKISPPTVDKSEFIATNNILEAFKPRLYPLKPLVFSGFEPEKKEWKWVPEFVEKGFGDVFFSRDDPEGPLQKVMPSNEELEQIRKDMKNHKPSYNISKIQRPGKTEKQEVDINVHLSGREAADVRVTARRKGPARVSVDTGRMMMGSI